MLNLETITLGTQGVVHVIDEVIMKTNKNMADAYDYAADNNKQRFY